MLRSRLAAPTVATVTPEAMVDAEDRPRFRAARGRLADAPASAVMRFRDGLRDYRVTGARAAVLDGPEAEAGAGLALAESPLVMDPGLATRSLEAWLRLVAEGRDRIGFTLPPSAWRVRPGTVVPVQLPGDAVRPYIVERVAEGEALTVEASSYDAAALAPVAAPYRPAPVATRPPSAAVSLSFLDLPLLPGQSEIEDAAGYVAAHADPWPGGVDVYRSTGPETGFTLNVQPALRAGVGETLSALPPGRPWTWTGETVDVRMFSGSLVGRPAADVLDGANALAILHPSGEWEVIQYRAADLVGASTWRLSGLIRGQRGTEIAPAASPLAAGARVVVLDAALAAVAMVGEDIGRPYWWRWVPAGGDPADAVFGAQQHAFRGVGRRPFAPVHLRADAAGADRVLSWVRRTRIEGDGWGDADPPVGESALLFRVEVGPEGAPVRVAEVSATSWTYSAAEILADGLSGAVPVRVAQVSERWGPGPSAVLSLHL